jgi:vacuolar-type H+-ATPase subunit H
MKITKVFYSKTFPIQMAWEKIGVEIETADDTPKNALYEAKRIVEQFHYQSNKAAEKALQTEKETITPTDSIINDIKSCKSIKVLEAYKLIAKSNKAVQEAYDEQLSKLL